jgi:hypothetical protein
VNASPDHLPMDLTTSKGIPLSKYSRVPPILRPWPLRSGRFAARAMDDNLLTSSGFESGLNPLLCFHAKR